MSKERDEIISILRESPAILPFVNEKYRRPLAEEVALAVQLSELSQMEVAQMLGVSFTSKGSSTVRRWQTQEGLPAHRPITYAAWRLLLLYVGIISAEDLAKK